MFGGEGIELMDNETISNGTTLPTYIQFLFTNNVLDTMTVLCILYCFIRRKKGLSIDEIVFYYSIVTSGIKIKEQNSNISIDTTEAKYDLDTRYFNSKNNVRFMIAWLADLKLIDIVIEESSSEVMVRINDLGKESASHLRSNYYLNIIAKTKDIKKKISFNTGNLKKILGA